MTSALTDELLETIDWPALRTLPEAGAGGEAVAAALRRLLTARDEREATEAQFCIETVAFVQGRLFEAAEAVAAVLAVALASPLSPAATRTSADLLVEIVGGVPAASEVKQGCGDLLDRCRAQIARGALNVHALRWHDDPAVREAALIVLVCVDPDRAAVTRALKHATADGATRVRRVAEEHLDPRTGTAVGPYD